MALCTQSASNCLGKKPFTNIEMVLLTCHFLIQWISIDTKCSKLCE